MKHHREQPHCASPALREGFCQVIPELSTQHGPPRTCNPTASPTPLRGLPREASPAAPALCPPASSRKQRPAAAPAPPGPRRGAGSPAARQRAGSEGRMGGEGRGGRARSPAWVRAPCEGGQRKGPPVTCLKPRAEPPAGGSWSSSSSSSSSAAPAPPSPSSGLPPPRTADQVQRAHCTGDRICQALNAIGPAPCPAPLPAGLTAAAPPPPSRPAPAPAPAPLGPPAPAPRHWRRGAPAPGTARREGPARPPRCLPGAPARGDGCGAAKPAPRPSRPEVTAAAFFFS